MSSHLTHNSRMARLLFIGLAFLLTSGLVCAEDEADSGHCSMDGAAAGEGAGAGGCSAGADASADADEADEADVWARRIYNKMPFTNEQDWPIHHWLDLADDHIVERPADAIKMFDDILAVHPNSVRAYYSRTRAMQFLNTTGVPEREIDARNVEIVDRFMALMKGPPADVLDVVYHSCVSQALMHTFSANMTQKKMELLEMAIALRSRKNERYHEMLVTEQFCSREYARAYLAVSQAAELFHNSKYFQFLKGVVLKRMDRKKDANKLLRALEVDASQAYWIASELSFLQFDLRRRGNLDDLDLLLKEASKLHVFPSRYQRPLENVPDLEARPVWPLDEVGLTAHEDEFAGLVENWEIIRDESLELLKNESDWMSASAKNKDVLVDSGSFLEFPLYSWGKRRMEHCARAPKTCALLKQFKVASKFTKGTIKFNVLKAGDTHLLPYTGPTNSRLRVHLALASPSPPSPDAASAPARMRVGQKDFVTWQPGQLVVFDDSFEHELWNDDKSHDRVVLSVDIPHPELPYEMSRQSFNPGARQSYIMY